MKRQFIVTVNMPEKVSVKSICRGLKDAILDGDVVYEADAEAIHFIPFNSVTVKSVK